MKKTFGVLATGLWLLPVSAMQTPLQLAPFNSIEVYDGAHVTLRHAPTQRVTVLNGSLDYSRVEVTSRGTLVIRKCSSKCPRGYRLEVEVMAPNLNSISLANSGSIQSRGSFPRQDNLTVAVAHGGTIDVRSMPAARVTASIEHGGGILTVPETWMSARVSQGGSITYWGNGQVKSSIEHGGVVRKGSTADLTAPADALR